MAAYDAASPQRQRRRDPLKGSHLSLSSTSMGVERFDQRSGRLASLASGSDVLWSRGVEIGTQLYASVIISGINPNFSGVALSLLTAPIWEMDLIAILIVTPIPDHFHRHCAIFFSSAVCIQIAGLLTTTFAPRALAWARYGGLLMVGFGLGPTVPICMTWTSEIFQRRQGEVGVAAASALVSGLGNLGNTMTTYALYTGWPEDAARGPHQYRKSNLTVVGILCLSSFIMTFLLKFVGKNSGSEILSSDSSAAKSMEEFEDGAARREAQERGFGKMWRSK